MNAENQTAKDQPVSIRLHLDRCPTVDEGVLRVGHDADRDRKDYRPGCQRSSTSWKVVRQRYRRFAGMCTIADGKSARQHQEVSQILTLMVS